MPQLPPCEIGMKLSGLNVSVHRQYLEQCSVLKVLVITNHAAFIVFLSLKYVNNFLVISLVFSFFLEYKLFLSRAYFFPLLDVP